MSNRQQNPNGPRPGLTLVELLVVLGILAILMGIAATAVKTGTRGKKQREAARQVNAFIAGAQARAMELNRPVGIEIVRGGNLASGNAALRIFMIETPPPYAGDNVNATLEISVSGNTVTLSDTLLNYTASASLITTDMKPDVRLNYRGRTYTTNVVSNSPLTLEFAVPAYDNTRFMAGTQIPVQIYLPPQRSSVTPVQLPTDMTIDLAFSGTGDNNLFHNGYTSSINNFNGGPIRFTFSPNGSIDRLHFTPNPSEPDSLVSGRPTGNIHLLIGKYEYALNADTQNTLISSGDYDQLSRITNGDTSFTNLADGTAMWVSINYLTGQVTTTRNKLISDAFRNSSEITALSGGARNRKYLEEARDFARSVITVRGQGDS